MDLVKPTAKFYSRGFQGNSFYIFLKFILFFINFRILYEFLNRPMASRHQPGPAAKTPGLAHASGHGARAQGGGHQTLAGRGGVATAGSPTTGPRRGLHSEHGGGSGVAPGKVAEGGAHPRMPSTAR
jgi:hypothetical protein